MFSSGASHWFPTVQAIMTGCVLGIFSFRGPGTHHSTISFFSSQIPTSLEPRRGGLDYWIPEPRDGLFPHPIPALRCLRCLDTENPSRACINDEVPYAQSLWKTYTVQIRHYSQHGSRPPIPERYNSLIPASGQKVQT
jgi:hypothetical protein